MLAGGTQGSSGANAHSDGCTSEVGNSNKVSVNIEVRIYLNITVDSRDSVAG